MKIFFYMFDFVGPQNACIGLGQALLNRGHQVYFVTNARFSDKFSKYGIAQLFVHENEQRKAKDVDARKPVLDPVTEYCNNLIENHFFDNISPIEKMKAMKGVKFLEDVYWKNVDFEPQIS